MNKKFLFAISATLAVTLMFTACGKKAENISGEGQDSAQSETDINSAGRDGKDGDNVNEKTEDGQNPESTDNSDNGGAQVQITGEEFEELVDTFNNTENEAKKEEARKKIEAVLKQAESRQN